MLIYAVDPGPEASCLCILEARDLVIVEATDYENSGLYEKFKDGFVPSDKAVLVLEQVQSYGKPVGAPVFETIFWSGRFSSAWGGQEGVNWFRLSRPKISGTLIGSAEHKKQAGAVNQRLIDIIGPKMVDIIGPKGGKKRAPGPMHEITGHKWEALALAVAFAIREKLVSPETMERIM